MNFVHEYNVLFEIEGKKSSFVIISTHFNTLVMFQLGNAFLKVVSHDKAQEITLALIRRWSSSKHNTGMVFNASADADLRRLKEEIRREKEKVLETGGGEQEEGVEAGSRDGGESQKTKRSENVTSISRQSGTYSCFNHASLCLF